MRNSSTSASLELDDDDTGLEGIKGKDLVDGSFHVKMRPAILILHPQLRASLPRALRKDGNRQMFARWKTTAAPRNPRGPKEDSIGSKSKDASSAGSRIPSTSPTAHAKTSIRRGMVPWHITGWFTGGDFQADGDVCRTTGAYIDLSWRNGANDVPGNAATHLHLPLWCILSGSGASIRCCGVSVVLGPSR